MRGKIHKHSKGISPQNRSTRKSQAGLSFTIQTVSSYSHRRNRPLGVELFFSPLSDASQRTSAFCALNVFIYRFWRHRGRWLSLPSQTCPPCFRFPIEESHLLQAKRASFPEQLFIARSLFYEEAPQSRFLGDC